LPMLLPRLLRRVSCFFHKARCPMVRPSADHPASNQPTGPASLYQRLGGYDAITAVVGLLLPRLQSDPQLGRFWAHRGTDGLRREEQLLIDFLCQATGGPLYYTGRDLKTSHQGMRISASDWRIFLRHVTATLDETLAGRPEYQEVLSFIESTRGELVEE
ncbi:MAG: group I truncated hemoglobin, partial [Planctomycetaceae bacterium]